MGHSQANRASCLNSLHAVIVPLPALSPGEVYAEGFARARRRRGVCTKSTQECVKRGRERKKKKKGDREWERQGPLTNE